MAGKQSESYLVSEAAKVLGVTPKRVRQMLGEGKLKAVPGSDPVRVKAAEVIALREQRGKQQSRGATPPGVKPQAAPVVALADVLALAESLTNRALTAAEEAHSKVLEAREEVQRHLEAELAAARQEAERLRSELAEAQARRRGLFRR